MSRQGKTKRRLFILLGGTLAIGALAGGGWAYRAHLLKQRAFQNRADGLAAIARGDYPKALDGLSKYLQRYPADVDVLLPYARARLMVQEPNGRQITAALGLFQRVLELKPGLPEAQNTLLDIYFQVNYNTEALSMADTILARKPDDINALRTKVLVLRKTQKLDQAETIVQQLTKAAPLDIQAHELEIQIMLDRGWRDERITRVLSGNFLRALTLLRG